MASAVRPRTTRGILLSEGGYSSQLFLSTVLSCRSRISPFFGYSHSLWYSLLLPKRVKERTNQFVRDSFIVGISGGDDGDEHDEEGGEGEAHG